MNSNRLSSAEILGCSVDKNNPEMITTITVAAVFVQDPTKPKGYGYLAFRCPFCGKKHDDHGSGEPYFGGGDGSRYPHCGHEVQMRLAGTQWGKEGKKLSPCWEYSLQEVEEAWRAGQLPKRLTKRLLIRKKLWKAGL